MRYVNWFGMLWRMSDRNFKRYLRRGAAGKGWDLDDFGTHVGSIDFHSTDANQQSFEDKLEDLRADRTVDWSKFDECVVCEAGVGEPCSRTGKRWEGDRGNHGRSAPTQGVGDRHLRKTPHSGRLKRSAS